MLGVHGASTQGLPTPLQGPLRLHLASPQQCWQKAKVCHPQDLHRHSLEKIQVLWEASQGSR